MTMALITAMVDDPERWERRFRAHEPLFRAFGINRTVFGIGSGNMVGMVKLVDDPEKLRQALASPEMIAAMADEGLQRDTLQLIILDRDLAQAAPILNEEEEIEPAAA